MNLEVWIVELLKEIESASDKGENFDFHIEKEMVNEIAIESRSLKWIEIY